MAISPSLVSAFNEQMTLEFHSAYEYLAMSAWLEEASLPGMAHWMRMQSDEEWAHGMRFYRFLIDRGGSVSLGPLDRPAAGYKDALEVFEKSLANEQKVTLSINEFYSLALEEKDFATMPLLDWFVNEQVEEEATVQQIIGDLRRTSGSGEALLLIDRELGARTPSKEKA